MNRFFYKCPRCLFKFATDSSLRWGPSVDACPICQCDRVNCLGATKGILTLATKCNDVCTFASGPNCSCSCAGANHGSRILVPIVGNVVQLDESRFPTARETRREWAAFQSVMDQLKVSGVPSGFHAWEWKDALTRIRQGGDYRIRNTRVAELCKRLGRSVPVASPLVVPAPGASVVIPSPASGGSVVADLPLFRLL